MDYSKLVHWDAKSGYWVVATYDERQDSYRALMNQRAKRLTGCGFLFGRTVSSVVSQDTYCSKRRSTALAAARRVYPDM